MIFYNEFYIYLGLIFTGLLIIVLILGYKMKLKLLNNFGNIAVIKKFSESINFKNTRQKALLLILSVFLIFIALARPQWGNKSSNMSRKGLNIFVLFDVSKSMLAEDMKPNRIEKAKHEISKLVDYLKGDRIGLIPFAGSSFVQCPLTIDYSAFNMYLDTLNVNSIPVPGTAIAEAIQKAITGFPEGEKKYKVIILITDGEDHEGNVLEIAQKAKDEGIVIYTIGIGSPNGELIPMRDENGNLNGYKKDKTGNPVLSRLDDVTLEKVALTTGGKYYQASEFEFEIKKVYDDILNMEKKLIFGKVFSQKADRFQWFLLPAVLLLIIEIFYRERNKIKKS